MSADYLHLFFSKLSSFFSGCDASLMVLKGVIDAFHHQKSSGFWSDHAGTYFSVKR